MVFRTERLSLRQMSAQDIPLLMEIFSDPIAMKYYPTKQSSFDWCYPSKWDACSIFHPSKIDNYSFC